jgi:hypothetical protein
MCIDTSFHQRLAHAQGTSSLRYLGCPEIADFDGSRGVPPDAIKPLVSTHLELMSTDYFGNRGSQLLIATSNRIRRPNY